ncbi:hypothetical protein HMPREF9348_02428 [Escherichia coli MS 145-7]|nr:hypothetical protein HMPREF9348_02428 [Escherichia coli MS 145-7]
MAIRVDHLVVGLSPLARGTPAGRLGEYRKNRFIPAGAGNTFRDVIADGAGSVYPRWRGEHESAVKNRILNAGLSPLARGTH